MGIKELKRYLGDTKKLKTFQKTLKRIGVYIPPGSYKILDIASDKDPIFSSLMAKLLPSSKFTHFKDDTIRSRKIKSRYSEISNLNIVYSSRNLDPPYDLAVAFFTLHELARPQKSLKKTYKMLKENGKIIIIDYDLKWFPKLAKESSWDGRTMRENFSNYIFTEGNERKVFKEETDCIQHHSKWGLDDYIASCSRAGFKNLNSETENVDTPWGKRPKTFLYIGEKI